MRARTMLFTAALVTMAASLTLADVKTQHRTTFQLGGTLGALVNRFGGDAAKDGLVETVALKGSRRMSTSQLAGRIIDLGEEKVYDLDMRKKEYRVTTFAELRKQWQDAQAKMKNDAQNAKGDEPADPRSQTGKQFEVSFDVKETGKSKSVAGHNTREAVLTITMHEKGKTLEEGGGLVMTNSLWLAPKMSTLHEITAFDVKFATAVYGDLIKGADMQQMGMLLAQYPSFKEMAERMATEAKKLEGTVLASTSTLEAVKSAEQMKQASSAPAPSGGGLMGRLASRMAPKGGSGEARTKVFTSSDEMLSIENAVVDSDVAIPAGFKEKK